MQYVADALRILRKGASIGIAVAALCAPAYGQSNHQTEQRQAAQKEDTPRFLIDTLFGAGLKNRDLAHAEISYIGAHAPLFSVGRVNVGVGGGLTLMSALSEEGRELYKSFGSSENYTTTLVATVPVSFKVGDAYVTTAIGWNFEGRRPELLVGISWKP